MGEAVNERSPGWKKIKKLLEKTSRNKRKSLKMLFNPSLQNFTNKVVDHHQVLERERKRMRQTKMSYNKTINSIRKRQCFKKVITNISLDRMILSGNIRYS